MALRFVFSVAVAAVVLNQAYALTEDEKQNIKGDIIKFIAECSKEFEITEEQLKTAKETKSLDGVDSCAIACFFKKINFIKEDGTFDHEHAKEVGPKYLGSEDDQTKFSDIADGCASVNDEAVSDGDKGCDRARLLAKCVGKHKAELKL